MRIALLGGSFDPPHLGHVLVAATARARGADAVWVLPSATHPYAKALSPWADRWAWCAAAFTPLGDWCRLCDDELQNPSGYTIDLVERLQQRHPGHTWWLVGGTDTALDLPNWHRGSELAQRIDILAVGRQGCGTEDPTALPNISSRAIRAARAAGEPWRHLMPAAVADLWAVQYATCPTERHPTLLRP